MGIEPFDLAERLDRRQQRRQRFAVQPHHAGAALELIHRQPRERFSRAAGGQFVAGAGREIARATTGE